MGCRRVASADQLVRLAVGLGGSLRVDRTAPGRGAWLCAGPEGAPSAACLEQADRRRAFTRALRAPVDQQSIATLRRTLQERARIEIGGTASVVAGRRD